MKSFLSPLGLARITAGHPWLTLGVWLIVVAAGIIAGGNLRTSDEQTIIGAESEDARAVMEDRITGPQPGTETIVLQSDRFTVNDAEFIDYATGLEEQLRALTASVASETSFFGTGDESFVSADRKTTLISVVLTGELVDAEDTAKPLIELLESQENPDFRVLTAGDGSIGAVFTEVAEKDLKAAEQLGLPAALIVLVFVFGAVVAAGVPVVLALLGIIVATGITATISLITPMDTTSTTMITMIGLAVGIDYTLFIVERFREERRNGHDKMKAIDIAADTSSRAVLFSGLTVLVALAGLLIVPATAFRGISVGAITAVIGAVLVALTLLPAVLRLLGDKINWLSLPGRRRKAAEASTTTGFWNRTTAFVMKHPAYFAVGSTAVLVALSLPYFTIKLGDSGIETMPPSDTKTAYQIIDREFSAGRISPTDIVVQADDVTAPGVQAAIVRLREGLQADGSWGDGAQVITATDSSALVLKVFGKGDVTATPAQETIRRLRDEIIPRAFAGVHAEVGVSGGTASTVDYIDTMNKWMPIVVGFVLTLSFILLLVAFRSIVLPVKAIILNLLSVGAAYGAVVAVFQHGWGADALGLQQTDTISAFLPIFMFAILFGLSMDYHVFLLSRIQERFRQTGDNSDAVAHGMRSTSGIITGAAAIMVVVFGGFAMGDLLEIQQVGFGLGVAIFLDATIVRTLLVPSSMQLLGKWNWYMPSWLEWLPKLSVEGGAHEAPKPAPTPAGAFDLIPALGGE